MNKKFGTISNEIEKKILWYENDHSIRSGREPGSCRTTVYFNLSTPTIFKPVKYQPHKFHLLINISESLGNGGEVN